MVVEIEKYPCNDDNEARSRERYWYELLNATMNTRCPITSVEEKDMDMIIYEQKYYETNKDRIKKQVKEYYEINKNNIKDYKREYWKSYYPSNKIKLTEKHKCGCGGCFITANKQRHFKSNKHLKYIQENELN